MKEVDCLCGERIVFLDDQVQVKTCPDCGTPVYQHAAPSRFGQSIKVKKRRTMPSQGYWMAALLGVVMFAVAVLTVLSVARSKAIGGAVAAPGMASALSPDGPGGRIGPRTCRAMAARPPRITA